MRQIEEKYKLDDDEYAIVCPWSDLHHINTPVILPGDDSPIDSSDQKSIDHRVCPI
jgi:hypothetical protein